jgi:hypothetical protein
MALRRYPDLAGVFRGDEAPHETMMALGIPETLMPPTLSEVLRYDADRMAFGESLVRAGKYNEVKPVDRSGYKGFGLRGDKVVDRITHGVARGLAPLMRAHAGPYLSDRREAVRLFIDWTKRLASGGLLDVLSIGTSQLTQSNFGEDWEESLSPTPPSSPPSGTQPGQCWFAPTRVPRMCPHWRKSTRKA